MGNYAYAVSVDGYHNDQYSCTFDRQSATSPLGYKGLHPALYVSSQTTFAEITDGTSNTIVLSEMLRGPASTGVDSDMDIRGVWYDIFGCGFSGKLSPNSSLGDECQSNCKDDPAAGTPAQPYAYPYWGHWANAARSRHPGGVNVCMVDGSVHFVTNSIDIDLWQALISANGGETVSIGD